MTYCQLTAYMLFLVCFWDPVRFNESFSHVLTLGELHVMLSFSYLDFAGVNGFDIAGVNSFNFAGVS